MNPFIQKALGSLIRWGLMLLLPYILKSGIIAEADATKYIEAGAVALAVLLLSLWEKFTSQRKLVTATGAAGITQDKVEAMIASPKVENPSVMTPKDEVPKPPKP